MDVVALRAFYDRPLGRLARQHLRLAVRRHVGAFPGMAIAGFGFASPYLRPYLDDAERVLALMPAGQGVMHWPPEGPCRATLIDDVAIPIPDQSLDRVIAVHALEMAESPVDTLREIWRVLNPGGRLIAAFPNRRGLWARFDSTPFGHGRPFSRSQVSALLKEALFAPEDWSETLYFPPIEARSVMKASGFFERSGRMVSVPMSGVIVLEASKQMFQPARQRSERRLGVRIAPVLAPRPAVRVLPEGR